MNPGRCFAPMLLAMAGLTGAAPPPELELPSCVAGSPALRVPASTEQATLDASDRRRFHDAAASRYPMYQRGGLVPAQVLMMRRGGHWQYATLWPNGRGGLCLSAVFAADRFDFTPAWLAKYRPRAGDGAD